MAQYPSYEEQDPWRQQTNPYTAPTQQPQTTAPAEQPTTTQQDYSAWGGFRPEGLDQSKVDAGHDSPKYQISRILSNFDPRQGITSEVLNALNTLGLGTFSGSGDRLSVGGNVDPRFEGVTGSDVVKAFDTGQGTWNAWGAGGTGPGVQPSVASSQAYTPLTSYAAPSASSSSNAMAGVTIVQEGGEGDPFAAIGGGVKLSNGGWVPKGHPLAVQAATAAGNASTTAVSNANSNSAVTAAAADGYPQNNKDALMQLLRERMTQDLNIDPNSPVIKNQTDNFAASQEKTRRQYLTEMAEKLSSQGLGNSGRLQNEQRFASENAGLQTGQFQAELMGRELVARRDEIKAAIDSMGNMLTEGERQALQRELAQAENAIQKYGIDSSAEQFHAGLGQKDRQFAAELAQRDRFASSDDAFRNAQLGQNQSQFMDRLGFDTSDRQTYWDALRRGQIG